MLHIFSLVIVAVALFLACLPPEAVSQQCRSGVTDEIRQSVREQLRQGGQNGTIPTVAVNCGQVPLVGKKMFITPRYAQNHATFISTVTTFNDTGIYFGSGRGNQRLLEVPLIPAGRFTTNDSIAIQITAVMNGGMLNTRRDRDPTVGVTDGRRTNLFQIYDINNYVQHNLPPCRPLRASGRLQKTFRTGPVPDQFTFLLRPAERFGACTSAIHGGYVNVGIFNNQLDLSRSINLQIRKADAPEDYLFYYFLVEIFQ